MAWAYEVMEQTLIPNTTMTKSLMDGVHQSYQIAPSEGYVLHDKILDVEGFDPDTMMPTGEVTLGYYPIARSIGANYDFDNTTIIDGYTAYGEREFFARPINEVPADQIFSLGDNEHEVM